MSANNHRQADHHARETGGAPDDVNADGQSSGEESRAGDPSSGRPGATAAPAGKVMITQKKRIAARMSRVHHLPCGPQGRIAGVETAPESGAGDRGIAIAVVAAEKRSAATKPGHDGALADFPGGRREGSSFALP